MKDWTSQEALEGIYKFLIDNELFTEEELNLVINGFGDSIETYNTICYVRYGEDVRSLIEWEW